MDCAVAQALEVVGERWTLLIVHEVFLGATRFEDIQQRLGIARNVLADRLQYLVAEGVLARCQYSERPHRHGYMLTEAGRDLGPMIDALQVWGDRWRPTDVPHRGLTTSAPDDSPTS